MMEPELAERTPIMLTKTARIILLLSLLAACAPATPSSAPPTPAPDEVEFTISLAESTSGTFTLALGVVNHGQAEIPADTYQDSWTLTTTDGERRASGEGLLPQIRPGTGQPQNVIIWEGPLEPGSYVLQWGVPQLGSSVAHFEITSGADGPNLGRFSTDG
jgi:hypothetical protein